MRGWALTMPTLKTSLGKNDVTGHVMTSSKIIGSSECCIDVWLIIFIILGSPSKVEYSGLSNTEKCKLC